MAGLVIDTPNDTVDAPKDAPQDTPKIDLDGPAPEQGTPEYDAYMAALGRKARGEVVEDTPEDEPEQAKSPQGVPEKFLKDGQVDLEALVKSYTELEKKLSGGAPKEGQEAPKEGAPEDETPGSYEKYFEELTEKGELSEDSMKTLTAKFPKYLVERFVQMTRENLELAQYRTQMVEAEIYQAVGGKEAVQSVQQWAAGNLSKGEIEAYNQLAASGNKEALVLALMGMKARMEAQVGRVPTLVTGKTGFPSGDTYTSPSEFQDAMADPKYQSSESYRQAVYEKLRRTKAVNPSFSVY